MNRHHVTSFFLSFSGIFTSFLPVFGQLTGVETTKFPQNYQLFPRDLVTNKATVFAEGTAQKAANLKAVRVRVFRGETVLQDISQPLDTNAATVNFKIAFDIPSGLTNYSVELSGVQKNSVNVWLKQANYVVAGDVFIINGQSNALGWIEGDNIGDRDTFMRTYFDQIGWREAYGTSVSKWGSRFLKNIVEKERVPVAVFNQALGGERINFFARHPDSPYTASNNYATLYKRLKTNDLLRGVRAIIWWQGESDGWESSADSFRIKTKRLFQNWREDYNNPPIFYHQIRPKACGHLYPFIAEAQRQMQAELPYAEIVSTNPAKISDGCHFTYFNGYDSLGNRLYRIVANKLYGKTASFLRPPNVVSAVMLPSKDIELSFTNMPTGDLRGNGNFWQDFMLQGTTTGQITGGVAIANKVRLRITGDTAGIKGVSYLSNLDTFGGENRFVVNPQNIGILQFYNFPITKTPLTGLGNSNGKIIDFDLQPTLVNGVLNVIFTVEIDKKYTLIITNALGQILKTAPITEGVDSTVLTTDFLPNGFYFAHILTENQAILGVKKFLVSR